MRDLNSIVTHCSDSNFGSAAMIDDWHRKRGWDNIGYHFVIPNGVIGASYLPIMDGQIEYGRNLHRAGAHVKGHNSTSIGICLIGKPKENDLCSFTVKQLIAAKELCLVLMSDHDIPIGKIDGHYELDVKKSCPGMPMDLFRMYIESTSDETPYLTNLLNALKA